jgi:hypothetical protein
VTSPSPSPSHFYFSGAPASQQVCSRGETPFVSCELGIGMVLIVDCFHFWFLRALACGAGEASSSGLGTDYGISDDQVVMVMVSWMKSESGIGFPVRFGVVSN